MTIQSKVLPFHITTDRQDTTQLNTKKATLLDLIAVLLSSMMLRKANDFRNTSHL